MLLPVDLSRTVRRNNYIGDAMPLNDFLANCENGLFIDYGGHASEVILNGYVISKKAFYPSDLDKGIRKQLLDIQKEHGPVTIVWYNR